MRRVLLLSLALLVLVGGVLSAGYLVAARYQRIPGVPAYRQGYGMAFLPPSAAALACRTSGAAALCLRGYFQAKLPPYPEGLPEDHCRGLKGALGRACSEAMGLRLVRFPSSVKLCTRLPDPEACARYVGRGALAVGGEERVKEECGKVRGPLLFNCQLGAAMEMVERAPERNLARAWALCERANPDGGVCTPALTGALLAALKDRKRAEAACTALPSLQAARCLAGVAQGAGRR